MPSTPLKLLLVEDSARDAELALLTLERGGLTVEATIAYNHQGVEEHLAQASFDLILCDFLLPGSSGAQVLQSAQRFAPHTPFIFLSGVFGEAHAVEMMRLGAIDYVLKQSMSLLPKAVKRALNEVRERKKLHRAEKSLLEVEVRARLAMDAARMGLWDLNPSTGELIWDDRCRALFEVAADTPVDMHYFIEHCHPAERPTVEQAVANAMDPAGDGVYQAEFRLLVPSNIERWVSVSGQAFFDGERCIRFTGMIKDISEQKQATEALERLNDLLGERVQKRTRERDRTWELSRELLAVMRFDMTPVSLNPAWEIVLGWSREQLSTMHLWELLHPEDLDPTLLEMRNIANGNVSTRFVNRMRHATGDYRWLSWTVVPDEDLMYAAVRDITGERAVLDELAAANQHLREQIQERERIEATLQQMQRLEAVGQLTAGVAHDFNNLLTVILTSASFVARDLEKGKLDKSQSRLQNIMVAGERGAKLTGQLLSFSRRQRLEPVAVNLNATVSGMLEMLRRTLGGSIWIQTQTLPELWHALVDPTQTEMIILNLAINARDAMPTGGTLSLGTHNETVTRPPQRLQDPEPGDYVVLSISDSGSGMSDEVLAKAFEPFFTTKEVGKGSGLGLAQVFGFAKQSGGGVAIVTAPGQGTTVKVYLPGVRNDTAEVESGEALALSADQHQSGSTILLVDDDDSVREVTAMLLDTFGYQVIQADSAEAALARLDDDIDLILTDYAMPVVNGGELARRARAMRPSLPILFITGYADLEGLHADEFEIVQKPFRQDELAAKLRKAINGAASSPA